ncbi:pre-mRNA cleavage complex 2 protein Pcf11-like [Myotis daubentonii]|uniref:pre-mRNA cleavage complex 2 protein Pcf11-like n=1 Tax=Myotis daubentonii TaxID=98922 RepID=UPI002873E9C2|nr:pre-mRNA cleavage complex 2 protein Pcf11-like [Myotis daubentonii]
MSEPTLAEAGPLGAREDACRDYQSSLEDLTVNSKPHINMLTILAQENLHFAKDIVSLIEAQTAKAPSSEKLPVMYLMDSIVKNVGREYLTAFTTNLVATFIRVFEKVDKNTRKSLFKLRSTWNEIFPLKILHALDVRVNSLDPAWPVQPLPPNQNTSSIHVTSTFLNKSPEEPSAGKMCHSGCKQSHMEDFVPPSREERNAKRSAEQDVRDPKRIKKTEDERPQENKSLQQGLQFPRHEQIFDSPQGPNFNGLRGPGNQSFSNPLSRASGHSFDEKNLQSPQCGNFGNLPAQITAGNMQVSQQVLTGVAQPVPFGQGQQFLPVHPKNPGAFVQNPSGALPKAYPDHHLSQADANELFSKLLRTGILKLSQPDSATAQVNEVAAQPPTEEKEGQNEDRDVPDLTNFTMEELKQRYDSVINQLHTGIQCYSCGMRFTTSQADVYADHLDWHYRQNRTKKDVSRKVTHRRWYYSSTDWIEFEEIADLEERAKSQFLEKAHEEVVLKTQQAAKEKQSQSVPAGPAGAVESCEICQDQFEQYWDDEEEEWHLKNAIRVDGKICHPSCYEDDQNTSSFDCTPSPSKKPVENPLNIMLNMVRNEFQEPCESTNVKEEQIDTPPACTEDSIATSQSCSRDMGFTRKDGNCPVTLPEQAPPLLRFRRAKSTVVLVVAGVGLLDPQSLQSNPEEVLVPGAYQSSLDVPGAEDWSQAAPALTLLDQRDLRTE